MPLLPFSSAPSTPGGSTNSIQINRSSGFYGDSNLTWDGSMFVFQAAAGNDANLAIYAGAPSNASFVSMYTNNTGFMGLSGWDNVGGNLLWRMGNSGDTGFNIYTNAGGSGGGSTVKALSIDFSQNTTFNGNVSLGTAGNKLSIKTGTNATAGTGTLSGGTVTIATTAVTASSLIFITDTSSGATNVGTLRVSAQTAGTSFVVTSSNVLDASTFNWLIIN